MAVGVSAVMIHKWEKDKAHPDESQLAKLADALGTSVAFLIGAVDSASVHDKEAAFNRSLRDIEEASIREKNVELAILAARQRIAAAASLPLSCVRIVLNDPSSDDDAT
jgi:transcriptional regulator with XRE-family HTH domain